MAIHKGQSTTTTAHKRRAALDKAKITLNRNSVLRSSIKGRLLLLLEHCVFLVNKQGELNQRRRSQLVKELRYACILAEQAGVRNGSVRCRPGFSVVVFELSCGDIVFPIFEESVTDNVFPRQTIAFSNNSWVLSRSITELVREQKNSAQRRSTRIPMNIHVEVESAGFISAGETITVNAHGALVRIPAPLKLGDQITVHVPRTGKSAAAAVVFANLSQFGIELQKPENIWGVAVPPSDWNTGSS